MRLNIFLLAVSVCIVLNAACQVSDSLLLAQSKAKVLSLHDRKMEEVQHFYNGAEYAEYVPLDNEHPYFETDEWAYSDLKYDGDWFYRVPLLLDLVRGKIIAFNYRTGFTMQLVDDFVEEFVMHGRRFVGSQYLSGSPAQKNEFYDIIYDGRTKVLIYHKKEFLKELEVHHELRSFLQSDRLFILKDGQLSEITSKRDILNSLVEKKREIKEFIRSNISMKQNQREASVVQIVKYFDSLYP